MKLKKSHQGLYSNKKKRTILWMFCCRLIGNWPNTYTFTKALAEALIRDTAGNLPIGIFRPAIGNTDFCNSTHL